MRRYVIFERGVELLCVSVFSFKNMYFKKNELRKGGFKIGYENKYGNEIKQLKKKKIPHEINITFLNETYIYIYIICLHNYDCTIRKLSHGNTQGRPDKP